MKWLFRAFLLTLGLPTLSYAQSASISGFVTDASDGNPLELVNVVLRDLSGEFVKGSVTNRDGLYLIRGIEPGRYTAQISFIGYEIFEDTLTLAADQALTLSARLQPGSAELDEAIVEAERVTGAARITAGRQTIRPVEIERIPTPDISGDLASYLTSLPGVISTGDRGGQLFIRGGEPTQNLVLLDNILLYQPFHLLGFYSAFPSDIINSTDVYAGGFGSRFAGRLSSVIDVATRNGNTQRLSGVASVSPFVGTVQLEGPLLPGRISLLVSGRQSLIEEGAEQILDQQLPFHFSDVFAKLHAAVQENSRASITALRTTDRGTLGENLGGLPPEEIRYRNEAIGGRYLFLPRFVSASLDLHISHSRLTSELGPPDAPLRTSSIRNTYIGVDAGFSGERVRASAGVSFRLNALESQLGGLYQGVADENTGYGNWGNYLSFDIDLGAFQLQPGFRMQFYSVRIDPYFEPRFRAVWTRGVHQISGAAGLYHQETVGLSDRRDAASVFTVWTKVPREDRGATAIGAGEIQRAWHGLIGYQTTPMEGVDFSIEGFYKILDNLFIAEWTSFPRLTTRLQPASGRSFGLDVRTEIQRGPFYGSLTYGWSNTRYNAEQASIQVWYGEESLDFRPPHDRRHQLNAVGSLSLGGFEFDVRWAFGSGLPFNRALGFDGFVLVDDILDVTQVPGARRVIYERPFNGILPTYHRLDVSLNRAFSLGASTLTVQASIINAYDRRNLLYLDVFTLRRADQLPFIPSLGVKVEV